MDPPLTSSCTDTPPVGPIVMVKEEDLNDEQYRRMIAFQDDEEELFRTKTDVTESNISYSETRQTTAENDVKKDEFGPSVMVKEEDIKEEEYGRVIPCPDEEEKPFAELHCRTETDVTEPNVTCKETQTNLEKKEEDVTELYYLLGNPVSLAQMKRVSVVLVDCCRPQGRRGKDEEEMQTQTNRDAEQPETSVSEHPDITQQKIHGQKELNLRRRVRLRHCTVCRKSFTNPRELEKHQRTHSVGVTKRRKARKNSHQCLQCGKAFTAAHLRLHMLTHTGVKPHKCDRCGKAFSQLSNLKTHRLIHTGEKPHECVCGKAFRTSSQLQDHMVVHSREKLHVCAECGKCYGRISGLQDHMLTMHPVGPRRRAEKVKIDLEGLGWSDDSMDLPLSASGCADTDPVGPRPLVTGEHEEKPFAELHRRTEKVKIDLEDPMVQRSEGLGWSDDRMDLPLSSGCADTDPVGPRPLVTGEHEEKPFAELHRRTEKVKIDLEGLGWSDDGMDLPLSSGCADTDPVDPRPLVKEEDTNDEGYGHMTTAEVEVKIEEDNDGEHNYLLGNHPHIMHQNIDEQNDELNLQLRGRPHRRTVSRKSSTTPTELEQHQQTHFLSINGKRMKCKNSIQCAQCGKVFRAASNLRLHMLTHTGEKPHKCVQCGKGFSQMSNLRLHMVIHTGEKRHRCDQCESAFAQISNLRRHMFKHTRKKPHKCDECGQLFSLVSNLQSHMLTHPQEELHECVECGEAFRTVAQLQCHVVAHVSAETDLSTAGWAETDPVGPLVQGDTNDEEYGLMIDDEGKPFAELHCKTETDVTDSTNDTLQTPVKIDVKKEEGGQEYLLENGAGAWCSSSLQRGTEMETDVTESPTSTYNTTVKTEMKREEIEYELGSVSEHSQMMQQKLHGDDDDLNLQLRGSLHHRTVCRKSSTTQTELEQHQQQTHSVGVNENSGKKPHECALCGKIFPRIDKFKIHMATHTGEKPHKCTHCGKAFSQLSHLNTHITQEGHSGKKAHKCVFCGKSFPQNSHLQTHMRVHTGERPHKCTHCGKAFKQSSYLRLHMQTHTGEKHHKCTQCGKTFLQTSHLKTHMLIHTGEKPHECVQCGKTFSQKTSLKSHIFHNHTDKKPLKSPPECHAEVNSEEKCHVCRECGKAFSSASGLKVHQLSTHTAEQKCFECGKIFTQSKDLKQHIRTHSGKKPHECPLCGQGFALISDVKLHMLTH